MRKIELVDLKSQYKHIQTEIDKAIQEVIESAGFINGPAVKSFQQSLSAYLNNIHVVPCANGTDALQVCMMTLGLKPGDEVITPAFTFAATAEVIALLQLVPKFVDVDPQTFNLNPRCIEQAIGPKTKAIVPVHLFGQSADLQPILEIAREHHLWVIEDCAQAVGAKYIGSNNIAIPCGTAGDMSSTSFFPSKNLGCYGDGGAIFTNKATWAEKAQIICNHGQTSQYYHDMLGINSRLDSLQAAILQVKLKHLDEFNHKRIETANKYDEQLGGIDGISIPVRASYSTHVFHQYTLTISGNHRDGLKKWLDEAEIPNKIYYPVPLHLQKAYNLLGYKKGDLPVSEKLCESVLSLPMHTELDDNQIDFICNTIKTYFKK